MKLYTFDTNKKIVSEKKGCLPFTEKIRKFRMKCKWKINFASPNGNFHGKTEFFLKGRPKSPNGISEWKMCVPFASFY